MPSQSARVAVTFHDCPTHLAQTELDLAFILTRWPNLPQHIRQTS